MKRYNPFSILVLLFALMAFASPYGMSEETPETNASETNASGTNATGMPLYGFLATMPAKSNSALSPQGVKWLAAMMYAAADNTTAEELKTAFHFEDDMAEIARQLNKESITDIQNLRIANGIWADKHLALKPEFLKCMKDDFKVHLSVCDFVTDLKSVQTGINEWIHIQTNGDVPLLFDNLDSETELILINTIYFQAKWENSFDTKLTEQHEFMNIDNQKVKLPMMRQLREYRYGENEDVFCVELPYAENNLAMMFILPKDFKAWHDVEKTFSEKKIADWCKSMKKKEVDCLIPKFKLTESFDLRTVFKHLGVESPFSEKADFTKMSGSDLFVSQAVQNVCIEIDESGTTASSASAAVFAPKSMPDEEVDRKQFYANRPFWFVVRNTETGTIFFLGRFVGSL